ncbi:MAG: NADH-quinone oxidoreductase subunit J [Sandaracinaceae bacterium]|nr:NADH-quinone oxidoreductase subunit J [Sandaracinaceae bacterium]MDW8247127.1 NADH-quinone oxidoreductase subunit J [Sandaracinaceae bacterium]
MSTSGQLLFTLSAFVALVSAVVTITQRTPLRAAMSLLVHIIALAGLYLTLYAHLLSAMQLIVYAGAVVVLFVFVIMLIGPGSITSKGHLRLPTAKALGAAFVATGMGVVASQIGTVSIAFPSVRGCIEGQRMTQMGECGQFGGVEAMSKALYIDAAIPFELASVLLLVAIIGAIAVARGRSESAPAHPDPWAIPIQPRPAREAEPIVSQQGVQPR